jgi:hypothetical protein
MKKFLDFFKKKVEKTIEIPSEDVVFNLDNFNKWFNDPNNNAVYSNPGIFLRLDKLSESHILDYMEKCYGIKNGGPMKWSKPHWIMIEDFHNEIREDWRNKLNNISEKISKKYL